MCFRRRRGKEAGGVEIYAIKLIERYNAGERDFSKARLSGADLCRADLRGADLRGADLREADLRWADLREADLREADLRWADLHEADLRGADLRGADLRGANLRWADLREADLREADLRWADLRGADLRNINVVQVTFSKWTLTLSPTDIFIGCERIPRDSDRDSLATDVDAKLERLAEKYNANQLLDSYREMIDLLCKADLTTD